VANTFRQAGQPLEMGSSCFEKEAIGATGSAALWATRPKSWPLSECRYRRIILLGFGMESTWALDKPSLRRLKGVRKALAQGKGSSGSPLAASYRGLAIIE
jgi:hypothetical protein